MSQTKSGSSFEFLDVMAGGGVSTGGDVTAAAGAGAPHGWGYGGPMQQLPPYDGSRRKDAYKNLKAEIKVFGLAYNVPKEQLGPRIWLRLTGEAKIAVEHLNIDTDITVEDGVTNILKAPDKEFLQEEFDEIDEVVSVFWNLRRETGQTMGNYIMAMHTAKIKMEKEDPDGKIGEKAYAVRLPKRAGLSREEKQQVLSATGAQYERAAI